MRDPGSHVLLQDAGARGPACLPQLRGGRGQGLRGGGGGVCRAACGGVDAAMKGPERSHSPGPWLGFSCFNPRGPFFLMPGSSEPAGGSPAPGRPPRGGTSNSQLGVPRDAGGSRVPGPDLCVPPLTGVAPTPRRYERGCQSCDTHGHLRGSQSLPHLRGKAWGGSRTPTRSGSAVRRRQHVGGRTGP